MHHEPSPCMPGRLARMHWLCMGGPLVPASPAMSTAQAITRTSTAAGSAVLPRTACICAGGGATRARAEGIFSHAAPNVNVGRPYGARFAGRSRTSWGAHTRRTTDAQSHLDLEPSALRRSAASLPAPCTAHRREVFPKSRSTRDVQALHIVYQLHFWLTTLCCNEPAPGFSTSVRCCRAPSHNNPSAARLCTRLSPGGIGGCDTCSWTQFAAAAKVSATRAVCSHGAGSGGAGCRDNTRICPRDCVGPRPSREACGSRCCPGAPACPVLSCGCAVNTHLRAPRHGSCIACLVASGSSARPRVDRQANAGPVE